MARLMSEAIKEGMRPKWYMGFSWYDVFTNTVIAYPIPFNLIIRWLREVYFKIAYPSRTKLETYIHEALIREHRKGREMGIAIGRSQIYEEINHAVRNEYSLISEKKD